MLPHRPAGPVRHAPVCPFGRVRTRPRRRRRRGARRGARGARDGTEVV